MTPATGGHPSDAVWPWVMAAAVAAVVGGWWWFRHPGAGAQAPVAVQPAVAEKSVTPAVDGVGIDVPDQLPGPAGSADRPGGEAADGTAPRRRLAGGEESLAAETAVVKPPPVQFPETLELDPVRGSGAEAARLRDRLLDQAFATKGWSEYTAMLGRSLVAATRRRTSEPPRPDEVTSLLEHPVLGQTLVRHAVLGEIADRTRKGALDAPARRPFFETLLSDPGLGEAFLINLSRDDRADDVLATWADLWLEHEAARTTHAQLALACALVFEKPASITWNDQPVRLSADDRFAWFVKQDAARRLTGRLDRMTAADLAWVVCAPVPDQELEWALAEMKLKQDSWGDAYGMVKYDMEKAVKGTSVYDAYTFEEILKKGGICGDQSYFAANTARAHGIPAAVISGDGARGPHAWIRWMDRDGTWQMQGRFDGYALGNATDAQTGRSLSEDWFVQRSERKATAAQAVSRAYHRLWLGRVLEIAGDSRRAGPLFDLAAAANRELPAVAEAQLRHWLAYRAAAPIDEWRTLVAGLKKDFRENSTLMALVQKAENEMIFPRQDGKAVVADLRKDVRAMEKQAERDGAAPKDEDLARSYARQAEVLKSAGDIDAVRTLYRRALDERSNAATFKVLASQYFKILSDHPEARLRACRDLETAWNRHVDTGGDYFDIGSQNSALSAIIACYREAGDTERADRLQKELDRRQQRAERRAL